MIPVESIKDSTTPAEIRVYRCKAEYPPSGVQVVSRQLEHLLERLV